MSYPEVLAALIDQLKKLPGVGSRTAERLALALSRWRPEETSALAETIARVGRDLRCCSICYNSAQTDPCPVCADPGRDRSRLLVVEGQLELKAFEEAGWRGLYHVLQGRLDPLEGVLPEDLTLEALAARIDREGIGEVVIATNPDFEGDGTALAVAEALAPTDVPVTRIARGIPTGGSIEYLGRAVLADALAGRRAIDEG